MQLKIALSDIISAVSSALIQHLNSVIIQILNIVLYAFSLRRNTLRGKIIDQVVKLSQRQLVFAAIVRKNFGIL